MSSEPEVLLETARFSVVRQSRTVATGQTVSRDWVVHPGAVTLVPMVSENEVCLIENYRQAVGQTLWELPAGTLEPGEDPVETARRELAEETGYRAESLEKIHEFLMSPGILSERMHLVLATGLTVGPMALEVGEEIRPQVVAWDEAMAMACDGRIQDAKTLVGLLLCDRLRG